jgi:hypothetical protein
MIRSISVHCFDAGRPPDGPIVAEDQVSEFCLERRGLEQPGHHMDDFLDFIERDGVHMVAYRVGDLQVTTILGKGTEAMNFGRSAGRTQRTLFCGSLSLALDQYRETRPVPFFGSSSLSPSHQTAGWPANWAICR